MNNKRDWEITSLIEKDIHRNGVFFDALIKLVEDGNLQLIEAAIDMPNLTDIPDLNDNIALVINCCKIQARISIKNAHALGI